MPKVSAQARIGTDQATKGKRLTRLVRSMSCLVAGILSCVIAFVLSLPLNTELRTIGYLQLLGLFHLLGKPMNGK
jgi:hypothetical protein